jgi:hypothetical protein
VKARTTPDAAAAKSLKLSRLIPRSPHVSGREEERGRNDEINAVNQMPPAQVGGAP